MIDVIVFKYSIFELKFLVSCLCGFKYFIFFWIFKVFGFYYILGMMMRGCLVIFLVFVMLLVLIIVSYWFYGSNEERCEVDLKVICKNIIFLKLIIIYLKVKIVKFLYRFKLGEEND